MQSRRVAIRRGLPWTPVLAALGASLFAGTLAGASDPPLGQRIDSARAEARLVAERIAAQSARLAGAEERAAQAAARESELTTLLDEGAARSRQFAAELAETQERLAVVRERYGRAVRLLSRRLVEIYKSSDPDYLSLVLEADGFDDLSTRAEYLDAFSDADRRVADRVSALHDEVAGRHAETAELKARIDEHLRLLDTARVEIASIRASAEERAAELTRARKAERSALAGLQERISGWELEVRREAARELAESEQPGSAHLGGPYAIPTYIVMCESGGNYRALNPSSGAGGAYQIIPSTWRAYGGSGLPHEASKAEQDRIAGLIWESAGPGAWSCA